MRCRLKLINIDVGAPLPAVARPATGELWALVRLHGHPLGLLHFDPDRDYTPGDVARLIEDRLSWPIARHLVHDGLAANDVASLAGALRRLPADCPRAGPDDSTRPVVTVAVCTRDRAAQLAGCLDALAALEYPPDRLDLLIVDNAPSTGETAECVRARGTRFRYVCEPRPGLDWARNRAVLEARGEIVAFTDDDTIVDPGWVRAIADVFGEEPDAMCVTGLVIPDELDAPAQLLFEQYGGFGRGFARSYARADIDGGERAATRHGGTGKFGTGANMAFRRSLFDAVGLFDPALDVGTVTNGGGDLEMFFRVIKSGHLLVYEPRALVRHLHRRTYGELRTQLANNGIGFYAYLVRAAINWRDERSAIVRLGVWWLWYWNVRRLLASFIRPRGFPRDLILAELKGSVAGLWRYRAARRQADAIVAAHGPQRPAAVSPTFRPAGTGGLV